MATTLILLKITLSGLMVTEYWCYLMDTLIIIVDYRFSIAFNQGINNPKQWKCNQQSSALFNQYFTDGDEWQYFSSVFFFFLFHLFSSLLCTHSTHCASLCCALRLGRALFWINIMGKSHYLDSPLNFRYTRGNANTRPRYSTWTLNWLALTKSGI